MLLPLLIHLERRLLLGEGHHSPYTATAVQSFYYIFALCFPAFRLILDAGTDPTNANLQNCIEKTKLIVERVLK